METFGYILLFVGSALTTYFVMRIHNAYQMSKYIDSTSLQLAGEILIAKRARDLKEKSLKVDI